MEGYDPVLEAGPNPPGLLYRAGSCEPGLVGSLKL